MRERERDREREIEREIGRLLVEQRFRVQPQPLPVRVPLFFGGVEFFFWGVRIWGLGFRV